MKKKQIYIGAGILLGLTAVFFIAKRLMVKSRAVSLAIREWKGWGEPTINKNGQLIKKGGFEANRGFAERVGEYWRIGTGQSFDGTDRDVAWSSAFISYLMKKAGAGDSFTYSPSHSTYIRDSIANRKQGRLNAPFVGYKVKEVAPKVGDLVCYTRQSGVDYDTTGAYKSHCDLVVKKRSGEVEVIGGNVNQSVTKRILKTDSKGRIIDDSKDWFTVIKSNI